MSEQINRINILLNSIRRRLNGLRERMENEHRVNDETNVELNQVENHLRRLLPVFTFHRHIHMQLRELLSMIDLLKNIYRNHQQQQQAHIDQTPASRNLPRLINQGRRRGAPKVAIDKNKLESLLQIGFTVTDIANQGLLGGKVHRNTLNNFMNQNGIRSPRQRYTTISDEELSTKIQQLHERFPRSGYREMVSLLKVQNPPCIVQRERVQRLLANVDPLGTAHRWTTAIRRRVYRVPTPNFLWHLDSNHKLIRWNFVTHGCIDGYSRLVLMLTVCTNNLAKTAFDLFTESILEYGIPSKIRVDGGGEFTHHASFMNNIDGERRCLVGKSVHNVRIERLWRDVREKVLDKFMQTFMFMESRGILDIDNEIHMFSLHYVFQRRINSDFQKWRMAHNNHPLRTEQNKSPLQLWFSGSIANQDRAYSAMRNIFSLHTEDREEVIRNFVERHIFTEPDNITYVLSCFPLPISVRELEYLGNNINILAESDSNGIDIYGAVVQYINSCLENN